MGIGEDRVACGVLGSFRGAMTREKAVMVLTPLQNNSYGYPYFHSLEYTETASTPLELSMDS